MGSCWLPSVGFAYDTDPVDDAENNTPDLALDSQLSNFLDVGYTDKQFKGPFFL